jgi:hypothetical protein
MRIAEGTRADHGPYDLLTFFTSRSRKPYFETTNTMITKLTTGNGANYPAFDSVLLNGLNRETHGDTLCHFAMTRSSLSIT